MLFAALVLGGCTRTIIERPVAKETVIEKPVVVERPAPPAVVAAAPFKSCSYNATAFSHNSYACQLRYQYRCNDGAWESTNIPC